MNLSPLQLDTNCFNDTSYYHSYFHNNTPTTWSLPLSSSSSSLLCPSTTMSYQTSNVPAALQPIENYCPIDTFYASNSEPIASSSDLTCYSTSAISMPPSSHLYASDEFVTQSSGSLLLPQNRANYTRHQLVMLNEIFKKHKYPNSLQKTLIAKYIGVSRDQIRIWFQNKRRKVQLINKGQAKQTKTDIECEYGEYRRHLPKNFLDDLFEELYKARGAPARLPVKREQNNVTSTQLNTDLDQEAMLYYPTTMNPTQYYYQTNHFIEHDDLSHEQNMTNYNPCFYSNR